MEHYIIHAATLFQATVASNKVASCMGAFTGEVERRCEGFAEMLYSGLFMYMLASYQLAVGHWIYHTASVLVKEKYLPLDELSFAPFSKVHF